MPRAKSREYYICPICERGHANRIGRDTQGKSVYQCPACGEKYGEHRLEKADRERFLRD